MNRIKPIRDITGQRFGNLEVLRMEQDLSNKSRMWWAICKCHICNRTDYRVKPYWVKGKYGSHTKSCGCDKSYFRRQTGRNSSKFRGCGEMNSGYVSNAERRAKKLKVKFDLDAEFLWNLYEQQHRKCALSNEPICFPSSNRNRPSGTISLDRIDSNGGYTRDNVQWVHKNVNLMKMYLDEKNFVDWCGKIWYHAQVNK